jgi:hypothetical protein
MSKRSRLAPIASQTELLQTATRESGVDLRPLQVKQNYYKQRLSLGSLILQNLKAPGPF